MNRKIIYEPEDDVLNIWFNDKPIDYAEEVDDTVVHFTKDNQPVYLEILNATKFLKKISQLSTQVVAHKIKP